MAIAGLIICHLKVGQAPAAHAQCHCSDFFVLFYQQQNSASIFVSTGNEASSLIQWLQFVKD